jgi:hypothetical protein
MPRFVEEEVEALAADPSSSRDARLLIGYSGDIAEIESFIEDAGGEVVETLPFDSITASIPETSIRRIIEHPSIETVELDSGMETLQGN